MGLVIAKTDTAPAFAGEYPEAQECGDEGITPPPGILEWASTHNYDLQHPDVCLFVC